MRRVGGRRHRSLWASLQVLWLPSTGTHEKKRVSSWWAPACASRMLTALQTCSCPEVLRQSEAVKNRSPTLHWCLCFTQPWFDLVTLCCCLFLQASFLQAPKVLAPCPRIPETGGISSCPMEGCLDFHFDYTFENFFFLLLTKGK